jgi:hypothetical protein
VKPRRRQPDPEPFDLDGIKEWEAILNRHRTWVPRSVRHANMRAEARQRQRAQTGATPTPTKGRSQSRFPMSHAVHNSTHAPSRARARCVRFRAPALHLETAR